MQELDDQELREFIELWDHEFHEPLSIKEARLFASTLLDLFLLLASDQAEPTSQSPSDEVLSILPEVK